MNKVILLGNLGKDAEIRTFQNSSDKVCNFSIATTEKWKDKNTGSKQEKTQWHSIAVFNQSMMGMYHVTRWSDFRYTSSSEFGRE